MKKRLNSSILAATSLTAATAHHHQTEANTLVLTTEQLSSLSPQNAIQAGEATTLDFSNLTPEIVTLLGNTTIDLSNFPTVRDITLPWFAASLNIKLPSNFGTPQNDSYSHIKITKGNTAPSTDSDLNLDLTQLSKGSGKIILDVSEVPTKGVKTGPSVSKLIRGTTTTNLTVADTIEAIETSGVIADDVKTSITLTPSAPANPNSVKPSFTGLPTAILASNPNSLDISNFRIDGRDVVASGIPKLEQLKTASDDSIGTLKVTGEKDITLNASVNKVEITSTTPDQAVVDTLTAVATTVAPSGKDAHIASFAGKTDLDFSKLDLGSVDNTATRIKEIFDANNLVPNAISIKIGSSVLAAVMSKMSITNLSSFTALKRLDIISATGAYQESSLSSSDLPSGLEEYYSTTLVVRKGTLTEDLLIDKKFAAATIDLRELDRNGKTISINLDYNNNLASTLKLNADLLSVSALKNLMSAGANKSVIVSGAAGGALTTANLQNVGTIDLRLVTGATSFSAPLDVDGDNTNLSKLYLPAAFDVEAAADILSGVDNGEVTVYLSGAYSGQKTLDASYDKTLLNFAAITGTGRFQLPSGIRGLVLSDAVAGLNVGAGATVNQFDLSGLAHLRQLTNLSTTATVLKLNNSSATAALSLNLLAATNLTTLHLNGSKVSSLTLPASAALTNGGEDAHLDLSQVTQLSEINQLNELLAQGEITQVTFPSNPASNLRVNLVDTIEGIDFNNLDKLPQVTLDNSYLSSENMWPTVKNKALSVDWVRFFNYITGAIVDGGINSPSLFDLSGQLIETQGEADALVLALNSLSNLNQSVLQRIIIRLDAAANGTINLSAIEPADFTHGSLSIIIDTSTGSTASVTVPVDWTSKTKTYESLSNVNKSSATSWGSYLNYHFASLNDKGEAATSLDLSQIALTAAEWSALMAALNSFTNTAAIQTVKLKLAAANDYSVAPAFTTATLSNATSIIIDVTGVKNAGSQVSVTGLPSATINLQVEQRVTSASSVDRSSTPSWKGYFEYLLSTISGTSYTLDLTASDVEIQSAAELSALSTALAGLSSANKLKIQNVKLKIATGNRSTDFTLSTDLDGFNNLASVIVDTTGALNGAAQSLTSFAFTNEPGSLVTKETRVTSLAAVDTDTIASWNYYLAYHKAQNINLQTLDFSSITLAAQADVAAFLTALQSRSSGDKSSVQTLKLKLASTFATDVDLTAGSISGLDHASFAVEVDRNGANSTAPVLFTFGTGTGITAAKTTIKDSAFTSLGSFDGTNAHHWLGYVRTLLGTLSTGTMTLDLTTHSALELNSEKLTKFITAMNALPVSDKAKVATLKIKLASGDFGSATADLSTLNGYSALTSAIIDRNGARESATLYDKAIGGTAPGSATLTINDPELRTVTNQNRTNEWLSYFTYLLNGMTGTTNTLDLSAISITGAANVATAFNNALDSLPSDQKLKVQTLKLAASGAVTVGTDVSGFTNLDKVIVDQTADPTAAISFNGGFGSTQKVYITSAAAARDNNAWDQYVDYALSPIADGGLEQPTLDLSSLTLNSTQVGDFLGALDGHDSAASITGITLKLAAAFGSNTLNLSSYTGLTNLTDNGVVIYRNGAANAGTLTSITVGSNSFTNAKVHVIDPTADSVADQESATDWLKYLTHVTSQPLFSATSGAGAINGVLNLFDLEFNNSDEINAFISALDFLSPSLKATLNAIHIKLADGDFGAGNLALSGDLSNSAGFTNLTQFMVNVTGTETNTPGIQKIIDFSGLSVNGSKDIWVTSLASVDYTSANAASSWLAYIHYMIRNDDTDFALDTSAINSGNGLTVAQAGFVFDALNTLSATGTNKVRLTSVKIKLAAAAGSATLTVNQDLSNLDGLTSIIVDATGAMDGTDQVAVDFTSASFHATTTTVKTIVTALASVDKDSSDSWTYYFSSAPLVSLDVSAVTLNSDEASAFLGAIGSGDTAKSAITSLTMKLDSNFGAASLDLSSYTGFDNLTANDSVAIYRNGASDSGTLASITYGGSFTDANVRIIDLTASTITDTAVPGQWLGYMTGVLNDAATGVTLDLSGFALDDAEAVTAFNSALAALDSALADKIQVLKLNITHKDTDTYNIILGTGTSGFTNLTRIEYTKDVDNTVTFASALGGKRVYLSDFTQVKMSSSAEWTHYLNYMLSTTNGGQSATALNLNSRTFADQTAVDAFFAGLNTVDGTSVYGDKNVLTTLRMTLADAQDAISIGGSVSAATDLNANLRIVVNPGTSTGTIPAGSGAGQVDAANLIVLDSTPAFSKQYLAYAAEQNGFTGTLNLTGLDYTNATDIAAELNLLPSDIKSSIKTINLNLASGISFGSSSVTLGALTDFTGVTLNIDRNGAVNGGNAYGPLVTVTNNTTHTVNLTDAEFHNMSTFDNESSAHWIGYLTHELNSAPSSYTLDLTTHAALTLDSANAVSAFNNALAALSADAKAKVATVKVKTSVDGELGTAVTGLSALANVIVEYSDANVTAMTSVFNSGTQPPKHYVASVSAGMPSTDWTRFFNYQLNAANIGGRAQTSITIDKRLSSGELSALLTGLGNATAKALLQTLTLNLQSDVVGDIDVGASGLGALTSVIINTNGSAAKLTPTNSFVSYTAFSSINNVKTDSADSWAAYLAGQSSLVNIDIREVELAAQGHFNEFSSALNALGVTPKATIQTLKLKLASNYPDSVDFSAHSVTGLTALDNNGVEVHRNGSTAAVTEGGSITNAKIKIVDLTSSSLTDRTSATSWLAYLTAIIEDVGFTGPLDLSADSDTFVRTNAQLTA